MAYDLSAMLEKISVNMSADKIKELTKKDGEFSSVYPYSVHETDGTILFMIKGQQNKKLVAVGGLSSIFQKLEGTVIHKEELRVKECPCNIENSKVIQKHFSFTRPIPLKSSPTTIGLGDRLGSATPGHIKTIKKYNAKPVLAQQSIRELNLTGRCYGGVLSDAVWAVFQEGYTGGFGADGDHLKSREEVTMALESGFTMITLDCSEHINDISGKSNEVVEKIYNEIDPQVRAKLEKEFLNKEFTLKGGLNLSFAKKDLAVNAVIYQKAVDFAIGIYNDLLKPISDNVDFEISIDETSTPTDPLAHYFVSAQLINAGVEIANVAPRFCGEFQKAIDYIGDKDQFEREFKDHVQIAEHFGYKLSIHSGSDKFSLYPIIGRETGLKVHVKTAGTSWLEAIKTIIQADPALYREIHSFALENLDKARKYYIVGADTNNIPDINSLADEQLKDLMCLDDARQVIHITFGLILQAKDGKGNFVFKDRIDKCLHENEDLYSCLLQEHIGKHLGTLGATSAGPCDM